MPTRLAFALAPVLALAACSSADRDHCLDPTRSDLVARWQACNRACVDDDDVRACRMAEDLEPDARGILAERSRGPAALHLDATVYPIAPPPSQAAAAGARAEVLRTWIDSLTESCGARHGLERRGHLDGFELSMELSEDGRFSRFAVEEPRKAPPQLAGCVADEASRVRLPIPAGPQAHRFRAVVVYGLR